VLGHFEPGKGREGTGTRKWGEDKEVGRGERAKPITLESGPDGCPCVFGRVGCCVGGVAVEAEPSGIPMSRILPSLKLECEKLASEKTEMQRHYVMYYEMSYGLNIEMHKQVTVLGVSVR
uniref:Groucho/TLE N-terminal Q-rich domain-containing protein n=1 Tax=Ursus maritimus TaxID=29073 RepID=A0A452TMM9_URSMA